MRKQFLVSVFFLFTAITMYGQTPQLTVDGKVNNGVYLQSLKIDIKVCGTIARTTWQMTFKNSTNRILEGNLSFPLKDGVSASRYALDINGKMREAVPVDRSKGTAVFEAVERKRIDPGLLEKIDGNVFRTRIYPIPAFGTRTVIIGYEEELPIVSNAALQYYLPLNLKDTISEFSLDIAVIQNAVTPVFDSVFDRQLAFDKKGSVFNSSLKKNNFVPGSSLVFSIPKPADAPEVMLQAFENKYCFLVNMSLKKNEREKILPKNIALIWDASLSGVARNTKKEIEFLDAYFKQVNNVEVSFQAFSNTAGGFKNYTIQNGDWTLLRKDIELLVYDGATNLGTLNLKTITADEIILVSDGHQTMGNGSVQTGNKPVYCINSSTTADYSQLKFIALKTGGVLIDLQDNDIKASLKKITMEPYRFLGVKNREFVTEFYPSYPVVVSNNLAIAGIAEEGISEMVLQFGYGNRVVDEKTIVINAETQLCTDFDITTIYGQKKITEMDIMYEKNKTEIERLGKQFGIITRNTSLIVLETLDDYLRYEIEPPAELRVEYQRRLKQRNNNLITKKQDDLEQSLEMSETLKQWYNAKVKKTVTKVKAVTVPTTPVVRQQTVTPRPVTVNHPVSPTGPSKLVTGIVMDTDGNPVPFATVKIRGSNTGLSADQNGRYSFNVKTGDVLEFSGAGYKLVETPVGAQTALNTVMEKTGELKEVVITSAFGLTRTARSSSANTQTISADELNTIRTSNFSNALAGKVAGAQVRNQYAGDLGAETTVRLRGENGLGAGYSALYVVNGQIMQGTKNINPGDVENVIVLEGPAASALFGVDGANGAIVITTKDFKNDPGYKKFNDKINTVDKLTTGISILYDPETTDYIKLIRQTVRENRYNKYLEMRPAFMATPTYFFQVATYFLKTGDKETGIKILSNLAELENASFELYKMLGYKLKEAGDYDGAISAFKKVLELRPQDPQSYRDYALALQDIGQYQQALDMLYEGMTKSYSDEANRIYDGIEEIFLTEINRLITLHRSKLKLSAIDKRLITPIASDLRIVMNWNMNNTDIDLWVTDPNGEKCYYGNPTTAIGGRISDDFTEGFGPEQFLLKKGIKGKYKIQINYFGDTQVTQAGPTTVMAEIYIHYGTDKEERKMITLQLKKDDKGEVYIGEVEL